MRTITNIIYPAFALACFALAPQAEAACHEGCDIPTGNTFLGNAALLNTGGTANTAIGLQALEFNAGGWNTASGATALLGNSTGSFNTATGFNALVFNTTGSFNTSTGVDALHLNSTGNNNIAFGNSAGYNLTGSDNIDIGNVGVTGESGIIRIGTAGNQAATFIAGISGVPIFSGIRIGVDPNGQLGVKPSSARYNEAIQPMDQVSEAIIALKPVTFRYKKALDAKNLRQFGLVAEEVAKVDPDLVVFDEQGKPFAVRYDEVNAMLLNEFLKEHKTVQQQGQTIARQQKQIDALTAGFQKVSAQLELSKSGPQTVLNNH